MAARQKPWKKDPYTFKPVFRYAAAGGKDGSGGKGGKGGKDGAGKPTTQMVGEEGEAQPPGPPGRTTDAIGEEGPGSVPTTTIAKGEEG